ncbi:MAG: DUF559 domain-containing protein [Solirubrobacterales bacterium]|nr:DUF559 domain-containing protein [Solirubrobacterales bacterium]
MRPDVDEAIAALAARQHGLIERRQLAALQLGREARRTRERRRQLHLVPGCPGVFAVGHPTLGEEATVLSAVLACGPRAYAAGEHGEWLWNLRPPWLPFPSLPVSVTVPRACGRTPPAARLLRRDLPAPEWQTRRGIPVVSVERLIADAGADRELWAVERLLDRALVERLTSVPSLERQLERAKGQRGILALRQLLAAERRYAGLTRSELEEAFLLLLRRAGVELPKVNERVGTDLVDALFAAARVVVELDGTWWHRTHRRQEQDRRKELRLRQRGLLVLRYTARQIFEEPEAVVTDLVRVLTERGALFA